MFCNLNLAMLLSRESRSLTVRLEFACGFPRSCSYQECESHKILGVGLESSFLECGQRKLRSLTCLILSLPCYIFLYIFIYFRLLVIVVFLVLNSKVNSVLRLCILHNIDLSNVTRLRLTIIHCLHAFAWLFICSLFPVPVRI